jgi:hypothetical protein
MKRFAIHADRRDESCRLCLGDQRALERSLAVCAARDDNAVSARGSLLRPQCHHRIYAAGAPSGDPTREHGDNGEEQRYAHERRWFSRASSFSLAAFVIARTASSSVSARAVTQAKATPAKSRNEGRCMAALFRGDPPIAKEQMWRLSFSARWNRTPSWIWKRRERGWNRRGWKRFPCAGIAR